MGQAEATGQARKNALLRTLPSIDELLARPSLKEGLARYPRQRTVAALRLAVQRVRARLLAGEERPFADQDVWDAVATLSRPNLRPVLNATGVVLHTNLGRAPLAEQAIERMAAVARGYSNLELDLEDGARGSRYAPVQGLLAELTGAESALVVNNNAAAVLLALSALAQGRACIVSRGELVEIGGGFRVPDVMRQSGCRLVEVGTTNRTRLDDYARALDAEPDTALLVKVHRSNFAQVGFTEDVSVGALAELGRARGVPVFEDLGSGALVPLRVGGEAPEPTVRASITAGADLVCFSGDKLLGGPQAGIVVGREPVVAQLRAHPLNRALRVDKLTVSALEATLELYRDGRAHDVPALRLLLQPAAALQARAQRLREWLADANVSAEVEQVEGQVGGGALPEAAPVSFACVLRVPDVEAARERLRAHEPPLLVRVSKDQLVLDVRCLRDDDLETVAAAVRALG